MPPRAANRRALSTRTSVCNPSRRSVDFSFTPVNSAALANKASSTVTVVLIHQLPSIHASLDASNDAMGSGLWLRPGFPAYTLNRNSTTSPSAIT
ncbi:Uncharacterised protein [Mycobacterium tuberculosis]|uniref:Uncharacterized protein n=1 Tax=Mycobacterium tuberculosis TaxID=1773 RepID=A0A916LH53_MYCTX|nr:Uncharacterised protein [Mycobacterium tuberculosis]CPA62074.1 Uncharacterised protein [Mycobacterium tuberculosis]